MDSYRLVNRRFLPKPELAFNEGLGKVIFLPSAPAPLTMVKMEFATANAAEHRIGLHFRRTLGGPRPA